MREKLKNARKSRSDARRTRKCAEIKKRCAKNSKMRGNQGAMRLHVPSSSHRKARSNRTGFFAMYNGDHFIEVFRLIVKK